MELMYNRDSNARGVVNDTTMHAQKCDVRTCKQEYYNRKFVGRLGSDMCGPFFAHLSHHPYSKPGSRAGST